MNSSSRPKDVKKGPSKNIINWIINYSKSVDVKSVKPENIDLIMYLN